MIKKTVQDLEDGKQLENISALQPDKIQELNFSFLPQGAKYALVRVCSLKPHIIDVPTRFFNVEKEVGQKKWMVCLSFPGGKRTFSGLTAVMWTVLWRSCRGFLNWVQRIRMFLAGTCVWTLDELTPAMSKMASGKAPDINGLPSDFFKHLVQHFGTGIVGRVWKKGHCLV